MEMFLDYKKNITSKAVKKIWEMSDMIKRLKKNIRLVRKETSSSQYSFSVRWMC